MPDPDPHSVDEFPSFAFVPSRYPYTYCADQIREWSGCGMSRSEASRLKRHLAEAVGMTEGSFARKVADEHLRMRGIERPA